MVSSIERILKVDSRRSIRNLFKILCLLNLLLYTSRDYAQTVVTGVVKSADNLPVLGSSIKIANAKAGAAADTGGHYTFKTNIHGTQWLLCSAIGYHTDSVQCNIQGDTVKINFNLKNEDGKLDEVYIQVRPWVPEAKKEYTLNDVQTVTTPGAIGDVAAALQTFPGASPAGNETGLFIHGGTAGETKAYIDGMLVKNAFGSNLPDIANRSRFSAFIFDQTTFTTSGYAAEYGGALSSSFFMSTKGVSDQQTSTAISLISLGAGLAHTQKFKNSELIISANYYDYSFNDRIVHQNTLWSKNPLQYHAAINYKLHTSQTGILKILMDYSDTRLSFRIDNPQTDSLDLLVNNNKNIYLNINYVEYIGSDWKLFAGLSYDYTLEKGLVNIAPYDQKDNAWEQKITLSKEMGNLLKFSLGAEQFQTRRAESYTSLERQYQDIFSAAYAEAQILLGNHLTFKTGGRAEYSYYLGKANLSPRTLLAYTLNPKNTVTFEYGVYYEKPDDSFLAQTSKLNYERADNYTLQYDLKLKEKSLGVQLYYKNYKDLVKIITPLFSGFQAYGPPVYISGFNNNGYGYSKGIDLLWKDSRTFRLIGGDYYIAYSYNDTKRNYIDYPTAARPPFIPENTLNLVLHRVFIKPTIFQLAATYTFSSGRTYFNPKNPIFLGNTTQHNNNLSLGISKIDIWGKKRNVWMSFMVNNILGFNQVYGYRYSYDGTRSTPILPPGKRQFTLSFLMNFDGGEINF